MKGGGNGVNESESIATCPNKNGSQPEEKIEPPGIAQSNVPRRIGEK